MIKEIDTYRRSQGGKHSIDRSGGERQFAMSILREYMVEWEENREGMEIYLEIGRRGLLWELVMKILCIDELEGARLFRNYLERQDEKEGESVN